MTVFLLRHGQTAKNQKNLLQGRSDQPLNETGRAQAASLGTWRKAQGLAFDRIYSSPLQRAVETARLAAGADVPLVLDERLLEMDYGPYEGASLDPIPAELAAFFQDFVHNPAPAGMEPLSQVASRMGAFLRSLEGQSGTLLVSTHAIALKGALEFLDPDSQGSWWGRYVGNCALFSACFEDGAWTKPVCLRA